MTIEETDRIDIISVDQNAGKVILHITDHLDWDREQEHLQLLQDKLNVYLAFLKSGNIYDGHPEFREKKFAVNVVFQNAPPASAIGFLEKVSPIMGKYGFDLTHETF